MTDDRLADAAVSGVSTDVVLTPLDLRLLEAVRVGRDRQGRYRTTYRLLAGGVGCARSTVHTSVGRLRAAGLITVEPGGFGLVIRLVES